MQSASGGGGTEFSRRGCGGDGGGGGGGLVRYSSAPATWLEALLEPEDEQVDVVLELPKPPRPNIDSDLEFLESSAGGGGLSNFLRQNSSPAEFMSLLNNSDGYFSSLGIPADFDYVSPPLTKRAREAEDVVTVSRQLLYSSTIVKEEEGGQLQDAMGGSLDFDMDNVLEDSVMCWTRAKRGCATHPRSIAERVRRTRISDRIRKLQDLVPNMDKQTNTADMLDEAIAYVKFLQKEIQILLLEVLLLWDPMTKITRHTAFTAIPPSSIFCLKIFNGCIIFCLVALSMVLHYT